MAINTNHNIDSFSLPHDLIQAYLSIRAAQVDRSFGTKKHLVTTALDRDRDAEVTHIEKHWRSVAQLTLLFVRASTVGEEKQLGLACQRRTLLGTEEVKFTRGK